ncbi:MAG: HD domain-containing protein [Patescibacteria group bacterium]
MSIPTREEAQQLLEEHVKDEYQRHHAKMVGTAVEGYAEQFGGDKDVWYLTGLLHDIDFEEHPDKHPAESLKWFKEWGYPPELIQAVEAHAYGYNGFSTMPQSKLDGALMACDEMCGIFYAYHKLNPIPYGQMSAKSVRKRFDEPRFAAKIERATITRGCEALGVDLDTHIANLIKFFGAVSFT